MAQEFHEVRSAPCVETMSDQTEDKAPAKRGLAEAEDEGDAKRSKIEQQVPPTEVEEDIESRLLRELEEEEMKEQEVAAGLAKLEEERLSELKEQAKQAEPQKAAEALQGTEGSLSMQQRLLLSAHKKVELQTREVQGPGHQSVWDLMQPHTGQEAPATVPPALPLAREAPVASAARAAEWHSDTNAEAWQQQQCAKEGTVEQGNEAPIATSQPAAPATEPVASAASAGEWHGDMSAEAWQQQQQQQQSAKEGTVEQGNEAPIATSQPPAPTEETQRLRRLLLATETPANSAARAAEWVSSVEGLADAQPPLDARVEKEGKKPDEDVKEALPKKVILHFNASCAPKIMGKAGGSITKVREATGAQVRIKKEQTNPDLSKSDCCEITISANNPDRVQKAKQMVIELAGEQPNP